MKNDADQNEQWQTRIQVIPDYMPPCPNANTKPKCVIYDPVTKSFLRQWDDDPTGETFWDAYGDDFLSPEVASHAIATAPPPVKAYVEFQIHLDKEL